MRAVILGLPPTTNNLYTVVSGRQVLSETGRRYHESVAAILRRLWSGPPSPAPFAVLLTYHLRYDRDVDGSQKVLLDGFAPRHRDGVREPIVWNDDRQLVLFAARKVRAGKTTLPYVSVIIRELAAQPVFVANTAPPASRVRRRLDFATNLLPPSNNNAYTPVGRGRMGRVKTREARAVSEAYAADFAILAAGQRPTRPSGPLFAGAVRLRLRFGFTADRRDVDGSSKVLLDAGKVVLWYDDGQITSYSVSKARVRAGEEACIEGGVWEVT
jgi:Holliday junction resolvase RusA-like endonuclease